MRSAIAMLAILTSSACAHSYGSACDDHDHAEVGLSPQAIDCIHTAATHEITGPATVSRAIGEVLDTCAVPLGSANVSRDGVIQRETLVKAR